MTHRGRGGIAALAVLGLATALSAQQPQWSLYAPFSKTTIVGDHGELLLSGGVRVTAADLEIRAQQALMQFDRDRWRPALEPQGGGGEGGPPRRGAVAPDPRRSLTEAVLRARLEAFVRAARGTASTTPPTTTTVPLDVLQSLTMEGDVVLVQGGREVARASAMHFSAADDRLVLHDALLRVWSSPNVADVVVVRGSRLVRQGPRITGRDVSVTTCNAGEPHVEIVSGDVEIIEREHAFEVRTRDDELVLLGQGILPLPDLHFYTDQRNWLPLKGATAGYSNRQGARAGVELGSNWNGIGGALHHAITGRTESEFRGSWRLEPEFIEARGVPIDAGLTYAADDLYHGYLEGFWLDDHGENLREIQTQLDGTKIDNRDRSLLRSENRVRVDDHTTVDLSAFLASDPAVWPEFHAREYREAELPDNGVYVRHADENRIATANVNVNPNTFSYQSDRSLSPSFVEELPRATFDWFAEPLLHFPDDTPLLLTSSSDVGWFRREFDPHAVGNDFDVLRADQQLELAAPFDVGPVGIRPFVSARATWYDQTAVDDDPDLRTAFTAGTRMATWLARSWDVGGGEALRHVMSPAVLVQDRFHVEGKPADYLPIDELEQLDERAEVRLELLNRLQRRVGDDIRELVWLDLAQTLLPDNHDHDHLGLAEYELILRPVQSWVPSLLLVVEGEHDWGTGRERTFNAGFRAGPWHGIDFGAEYREDYLTRGTIGYYLGTQLFGRWSLTGRSQYDLESRRTIDYLAQLVRHDHDWILSAGLVFDTISNETRFYVNFQPLLGNVLQPRQVEYLSGTSFEGL